MNINSFLKNSLYLLTILLCFSCDNDFNTIETNLIGDSNFAFGEKETEIINAFNQKTGSVESYNLSLNSLGIYENPGFGTTTANFATQVLLATENPTLDPALLSSIEIDDVYLNIPYFSTKTAISTEGVGTYELDSIYGPEDSKLKLGVYESGVYMKNYDPIKKDNQIYYTNQNNLFNTNKGVLLNDDSSISQNEAFYFNKQENYDETTKIRTAPGIKLKLNKDFFKTKLFSAAANGKLASNDIFTEYFKGLYFKVEKSGASPSNIALLNFKAGTITIKYKQNTSIDNTTKEEKSIILNLSGNCVNLFENQYTSNYTNAISSPNTIDGDTHLYLKGGEGSLAVISLFGPDDDGNGIADKLEQLRAKKWLVNDASITFTIDNSNLTDEPNRIYLYDLNSKIPLIDYITDGTTRTAQKYSKYIHGGIIEKDASGKGIKYKLKLTNHIRKLIKNDTVTNVKLGLVVTENINDITNKMLENPVFSGKINYIPTSSVINPLGTILYGSNASVAEDKRMKFEIYYTKPK